MFSRRKAAVLAAQVLLLLFILTPVRGQDPAGDPTGSAGDYNGLVTTAGSYDPYTGNAKRVVTDLVVPGSNGCYPLAFTRYSNSRAVPVDGDPSYFAESGNWRHSYQWLATNEGSGVYTVAYPDGRVIHFRMGRPAAPTADPYAHGSVGIGDRLEIASNGVNLYLHMADGGIVTFAEVNSNNDPGVPIGVFRAYSIADKYGAVTTLTYGTTQGQSYLTQVTEPGGRSLIFSYTTLTYTSPSAQQYVWVVLTQVSSVNTQGTITQSVTYGYPQLPVANSGTYYQALVTAVYNQEPGIAAVYNYYQGNGGFPPLLVNCDDPHYAGPMARIQYNLQITNATVWGIVNAEANFPRSGSGEAVYNVSTLGQNAPNTPTTATDSRGDHADVQGDSISRSFYYGQSSTNGLNTNAVSFQPTTVTDFQSYASYLYYNASGSANGASGCVSEIIDASGTSTKYQTEPYVGKVTNVTLQDGRTRSTVWESMNGATRTTSTAPGCFTPYYVLSTTDERGNATIYYRYSNTGYPYAVDYADGTQETYSYQGFSGPNGAYYKVATYTTRLGATIKYTYSNSNGGSGRSDLLTTITRSYSDINNAPHNETTTLYYDGLDRVNKVVDPGGVTDKYLYNGRHQLVQILHTADGTHADYTYDAYGHCTSVSDELTDVTSFQYDDYGRPTSVKQPVNAYGLTNVTTQFTYDRRDNSNNVLGAALSQTSSLFDYKILPSGRAEQRIYTPNNWLFDDYIGQSNGNAASPYFPTCMREAGGIVHDPMGRVQQYTDAQGQVWKSSYDPLGRLNLTTDPLGHNSKFSYYPAGSSYAGLLQSITVPGADLVYFPTATTTYTSYDTNGFATGWSDPYPHKFTASYDANGDVLSQSDGINATSYKYDQLGRKINAIYPDNRSAERWTYCPGGMVNTYTNRAGLAQCTYLYNSRNQLQSKTWSDGTTLGVTYTFNAANQLTEVQNQSADIRYTPDSSGATSVESELVGGQSARLSTIYNRNVDGNVISIQYPNGNLPCFSYDYVGRCSGMYSGSTTYSAYGYTGDWLTNCSLYNGMETSYGYQNNGRVSSVDHYHGTSNVDVRFYGYAPDGQISWFARAADGGQSGSSLENGRGDSFYYWGDGSLGDAYHDYANTAGWPDINEATGDARVDPSTLSVPGGTNTYADSYTYDAAGNRSQVSQLSPTQNIDYAAGVDDTYGGSSYDGNLDTTNSAVGWTYNYDAEGKMISGAGPGGAAVSFSYDGLGRVIGQNNNGALSLFYYSGAQRIEERNFSNVNTYLYFYAAPGSDQLLFRQNNAWFRLWYLTDLIGNTSHLATDSGQVIEQYLYDAYGTPSFYDGAGNPRSASLYDNRYLFQSSSAYEWLSAPALYYCRARFYLPEHGRWLAPDPIGQAGGLNLYTYCGNDPVNGTDPSGLDDPDGPPSPSQAETAGGIGQNMTPGLQQSYGDGQSGSFASNGDWSGNNAPSDPPGQVTVTAPAPETGLTPIQQVAAGELNGGNAQAGGDENGGGGRGGGGKFYPITSGDGGFGKAVLHDFAPDQPLGNAIDFYRKASIVVANVVTNFIAPGAGQAEEAVVGGKAAAEGGAEAVEEAAALGGKCFPKGTLVSTPTGEKSIENLQVGDLVYSYNFETNQVLEEKIEKLNRNFTYHWAVIEVDGETIRATRSHPFWVENERRWYKAADLKPGMWLRRQNGSLVTIHAVVVEDLKQPQDTYNFVVAHEHNYFVGNSSVLVHNGPDFIVTPNGQVFPVPQGATGPLSTRASGFQFTGGSGGNGLDSRITGVRFMDANANQGARAVYMNSSGQTANPFTGRTIPPSDPLAHIPCP